MSPQHPRQPVARPYGMPAGIQLLGALARTGMYLFTAVQAADAASALGLTKTHTNVVLHQLAAAGWITRVKKGLYATNDPLTQAPRAHPFSIGVAITTPAAISHWSAFQHWGLTEPIPAAVTVSSPTRTCPPACEVDGAGERPAWTVAGVRYEFISLPAARFFGIAQLWLDEQNHIPIFEPERALLDAFYHLHVFGSLSVGMQILEVHLSAIDAERLTDYAIRFGVAAVAKRVGWVLERLGASKDVLQPLMDYPVNGDSPLDPTQPARGRHNPTWHVIENLGKGAA